VECGVDHGPYGFGSAEGFGCLGVPRRALLAEAAGLVFSLPGFQSGLLRQPQRLHRRRRPAMITLKIHR
jgi:hypothetical protein